VPSDIGRYHRPVPDILIRDVPAEDLARIDAQAARLGLSRTEYLRRRLRQEAARAAAPVTAADLVHFSERFADLADPEVMRRAWS
jgi:Ribbon-helix-helix protein, copG family